MKMSSVVLTLAAMALCAGSAYAATPQESCPITGKKVDRGIYADYEGKRVYFCCAACPESFKKDPARYVKEMEAKGITLDKIQTTCPVMGGKINKAIFVDHDGKRVYLCCAACVSAVKKDPAKYIKKLEAEGIVLDKTPSPKPGNSP